MEKTILRVGDNVKRWSGRWQCRILESDATTKCATTANFNIYTLFLGGNYLLPFVCQPLLQRKHYHEILSPLFEQVACVHFEGIILEGFLFIRGCAVADWNVRWALRCLLLNLN